jgi:predicted NUDIX family NTP pyrophosphohydrolase
VLYRWRQGELQVLLLHMGGPYWSHKDAGAWTIPKGEYRPDEDALIAAQREFLEETGQSISGSFLPLTPIKQRNGKIVTAWAIEGDFEPSQLRSNLFSMEWPPRSGQLQQFPEVDRAAWFTAPQAREKMIAGQAALMDQLQPRLTSPSGVTGAIVDTSSPDTEHR